MVGRKSKRLGTELLGVGRLARLRRRVIQEIGTREHVDQRLGAEYRESTGEFLRVVIADR